MRRYFDQRSLSYLADFHFCNPSVWSTARGQSLRSGAAVAAFTLLETEERSVAFLAPSPDQLDIRLAPDMRRHLLLFFREAVTNVSRHADAKAVRVEISLDGGLFLVSIRDNGRGFDPFLPRSGRGLKSLLYRAHELRGGCRVELAPMAGTKVELSLPLIDSRSDTVQPKRTERLPVSGERVVTAVEYVVHAAGRNQNTSRTAI